MSLLSRILLGALLVTGLGGCGRYYEFGQVNSGRGRGEFAYVSLSQLAIVGTAEQPPDTYVTNVYYVNGAAPVTPPRSRADRMPTDNELPSFDPHVARAALKGVDASSCRAVGAKSGFGHAKVTMNPEGRISKVVVDAPSGLSPEAAKCVGEAIGTATMPPFKGSLVTIGTTYYVK